MILLIFAVTTLFGALATVVDFVMIFSCPWIALIKRDTIRELFARAYFAWSWISIFVGVLGVAAPIAMFIDYWGSVPGVIKPEPTLSGQIFRVALGLAYPGFPLVLGYILRRFSSELRRSSDLP
jgi:hypothetical protein